MGSRFGELEQLSGKIGKGIDMAKYVVKDLAAVARFLPYGLIVGILAVVVLCIVNDRRVKRKKKPLPVMASVSYFMYLAILIIITFLSRESGSRNGVDLELFSTWGINTRNNAYVIENVLLFIPYGVFSCWIFVSVRNLLTCTLLGLVSSMAIEYLQMMTGRGYFQVDDIITNTIGMLIGYIIFRCVYGIVKAFHKQVQKKTNTT